MMAGMATSSLGLTSAPLEGRYISGGPQYITKERWWGSALSPYDMNSKVVSNRFRVLHENVKSFLRVFFWYVLILLYNEFCQRDVWPNGKLHSTVYPLQIETKTHIRQGA